MFKSLLLLGHSEEAVVIKGHWLISSKPIRRRGGHCPCLASACTHRHTQGSQEFTFKPLAWQPASITQRKLERAANINTNKGKVTHAQRVSVCSNHEKIVVLRTIKLGSKHMKSAAPPVVFSLRGEHSERLASCAVL